MFLPRTLLSWSVPSRPRKNFKIAADSVEDYVKEARNFCQTEESVLYLSMNLMKRDYEHEKELQLLLKEKEKESELLLKEKESELLLQDQKHQMQIQSELLLQDQKHQMQIQEAYLMKLLSVATLRFAYNRFIIFAFAVLRLLICFQY